MVGSIGLGTTCALYPVITYPLTGITDNPYIYWTSFAVTILNTVAFGICFMLALPVVSFNLSIFAKSPTLMTCSQVQTMLSNAMDPTRGGLLQGAAQGISSLARSFGPIVGGGLYVISVKFRLPWVAFIVIALCYYCSAWMAYGLPPSVQTPRTQSAEEMAARKALQMQQQVESKELRHQSLLDEAGPSQGK